VSAPARPLLAGRARMGVFVRALRAVAVPYVVARVVVLAALGIAHLVVSRGHASPAVIFRVHQGLLAWDAGFYESIAHFGYAPFGHQALRFFPLLPLVARALGTTGLPDAAGVVVVANVGALMGTVLLVLLVRRETGDEQLARRSAWVLSLAPPAFCLVLGYAEGLLLALSVGCFLCIRPAAGSRPRWWWAAGLGYAAALTRPLGVLVAFAVLAEGVRWWQRAQGAERLGILAALAGPPAGIVTFLGWSAAAEGDFWLPLRVQTSAGHHGGLSDPVATVLHDADGVLHHHLGTALHVPWVLLVVVLVVAAWRTLPASYGAFATAVVAVAVTGTNLDSFERYALSAFPLVVVVAMALRTRWFERAVLTGSGALLFAYSLAAFLNRLVP